MNKQILLVMKRSDRAGDLLPYVEKVSRPGMKVIFMVPYPTDGFCWAREEFGRKGIAEAKRLADYYRWDTNVEKAKARIAPFLKSLTAKGIEVAVELYAGSMRRAVKEHATKGDVHLIVTSASIGERIAGVLSGSNPLLDLFKRPVLSPVLLIHPASAA
jgi:hypothetical protein